MANASEKAPEAVDVVIVGAGASGSVYAAVLAEAGKSVLVLERGRARKLDDLYSSQVWARRLKWGSPHVVEDPKNDSIWYNFNAGHGFGGAAIHHYGVWPRYHPEDFELKTRHGRGLDWPYGYDELRPYYDQVQDDVGISGDAALEVWRPPGKPYPLPPVLVTTHGRTLARGFERRGLRTSPIPIAVLSRPYKGRPSCLWDTWCDAGCPTGALANPLVTYLPRARQAGAVLRADAHIRRVVTDDAGRRATGVEYADADGRVVFQPARAVVLCAFTVENARILLNSAGPRHPDGLANGSGAVGRYLMVHPAVGINGMFGHEMENFLGATGGQLFCQDRFAKTGNAYGAFGSVQFEIGLGLKPNDLLGIAMARPDIHGPALHRFMRDGAHHMGSMVGVCEDGPQWDNRIELSRTVRDRHGLPAAQVTYKYTDDGMKLWKAAAAEGVEIFKAAGATSAWHSPPGSQHIMGGTVMGRDPKTSVLNGEGQSHEVPNLFVGGPSVFPTGSCVNSTFTAHATAMKSATFMARNWSAL